MEVAGFTRWFNENKELLTSDFSATLFELDCNLNVIFSAAYEDTTIAEFFSNPEFESEWQIIIHEMNDERKEQNLYQIEIQDNIPSFNLLFGLFIFNKAMHESDSDKKIGLLLQALKYHSYAAAKKLLSFIMENLNNDVENTLVLLLTIMEKLNNMKDSAGYIISAFSYLKLVEFFKDENPLKAGIYLNAAKECFHLAEESKASSGAAINNCFSGKHISEISNLKISTLKEALDVCGEFENYIENSTPRNCRTKVM